MRLLPRGNRSIAVVNREERWLAAAVALARSPSLALRQQSRVQAHDAGPRLPVQKPSDQPDKAKALHIAGFLSFWSPSWFQAGVVGQCESGPGRRTAHLGRSHTLRSRGGTGYLRRCALTPEPKRAPTVPAESN